MTIIANSRRAQDADKFIAGKIREWRIRRQITQMELGEALGVTFQQVQKYETGVNRVSGGRLDDIARTLQIEVADLLPPRDTVVVDIGPDPVRDLLKSKADRPLLEQIAALDAAQRAAMLRVATALGGK